MKTNKKRRQDPDPNEKAQDGGTKPESTPAIPAPATPELMPTSTSRWSPEAKMWLTTTAMVNVVFPENAPPDADIQEMPRMLDEARKWCQSVHTIDRFLQFPINALRYWVRYRGHKESKEFFATIRPLAMYLCAGHPEIGAPLAADDPEGWLKWFEDAKVASEKTREAKAELSFKLTAQQRKIINAIGDDTLKAQAVAHRMGRKLGGSIKTDLAFLRNKVLGNDGEGYYVKPEFHHLIQRLTPRSGPKSD